MKENLLKALKEGGFVLGTAEPGSFNLKNAGSSGIYADIKEAYGNPGLRDMICREMHLLLPWNTTCLAGSGVGGITLASAIATMHHKHLTILRDEPKRYGTNKIIEGYVPGGKDYVAIVDDVMSTGESLKRNIAAISDTGANILGCYVVVRRGGPELSVPVRHLFTLEELL